MGLKSVYLIVLVLTFVEHSFQQTVTNAKGIETEIFTTNSYNKNVRPITDQSQPVDISMTLHLLGIDDFIMVEQKIQTSAYLTMEWTDSELTWNSATYGGITEIFLPQGQIWRPDVILENDVAGISELGHTSLFVQIGNDGKVKWKPYESFQSKCSVDTSFYPFDSQTCSLIFTGWTTNAAHIRFNVGSSTIDISNYESNGEWMLISTSAVNQTSGSESSVSFNIKLQRRPLLILINVFLPILYLGMINCYLFILPVESGEKIGYAVTLFLSLAVFLTLISDNLPQNATKMPAVTVYLTARALLGTLSVMATITLLNIYYREDSEPIPKFLQICHRIKVKVRKALCCCCKPKCKKSKVDNEETDGKNGHVEKELDLVEEDEEDNLNWQIVAKSLDFLFLILFLMAEMIFAMFFFITATMHLPY